MLKNNLLGGNGNDLYRFKKIIKINLEYNEKKILNFIKKKENIKLFVCYGFQLLALTS